MKKDIEGGGKMGLEDGGGEARGEADYGMIADSAGRYSPAYSSPDSTTTPFPTFAGRQGIDALELVRVW